MPEETINQEPVSDNSGLAIAPDDGGDGGQTPQEPVVEPQDENLPEAASEPTEPEEHDDPMPQAADPNAIRAWIGRREKRLTDNFDQKLNQLVGLITPLFQQTQQPQAMPQQPSMQIQTDIAPEDLDFINDPKGSFDKLAESFANKFIPKYNADYSMKTAQKANQIINGISFLAKSDPLVKDDADRVVEIAKTLSVPNFDTIDANTATKWAYSEAQNRLLREKMQKKINPLQGNKPTKQPIGSVNPSAPSRQAAQKTNVSSEILDVANKMGLTEQQAIDLLKE
jgi:hypothetical protein